MSLESVEITNTRRVVPIWSKASREPVSLVALCPFLVITRTIDLYYNKGCMLSTIDHSTMSVC